MSTRSRKRATVSRETLVCCPRLFVSDALAATLREDGGFDDAVELSTLPARLEASSVEQVTICFRSAADFVALRAAEGAAPAAALGEWMVVARRIERLLAGHGPVIKLLDVDMLGSAASVYAAYLEVPVEALAASAAVANIDPMERRFAAMYVAENAESATLEAALDGQVVRLVNETASKGADAASVMARYRQLLAAEERFEEAEAQIRRLKNRMETVEEVASNEREHALEMNEAIQRELETCHVQQRSLELRLMSLEQDRDMADQRAREIGVRAERAEVYANELHTWREDMRRSLSYRLIAPLRRLRGSTE